MVDHQTANALAETHLKLADYVAHEIRKASQVPRHVDHADLRGAAVVALVESAHRFDPDRGAKFGSYAATRMRGAVLDLLRADDWASRSVRTRARDLHAASAQLWDQHGRRPTQTELAAALGITAAAVDRTRQNINQGAVISLNELKSPEGKPFEVASSAPGPEQILIAREETLTLLRAVDALPEQYRRVITRNYLGEETLTAIAADSGLTLSRISQIRTRGLALLHAALTAIDTGRAPEPAGGVRARREQTNYVTRVTTPTRKDVA